MWCERGGRNRNARLSVSSWRSLHSQILLALVNASLQWSAARSREGLAVRAWRSQDGAMARLLDGRRGLNYES